MTHYGNKCACGIKMLFFQHTCHMTSMYIICMEKHLMKTKWLNVLLRLKKRRKLWLSYTTIRTILSNIVNDRAPSNEKIEKYSTENFCIHTTQNAKKKKKMKKEKRKWKKRKTCRNFGKLQLLQTLSPLINVENVTLDCIT